MPADKIANVNKTKFDEWKPSHHVLACRGMPIPIRVTEIKETTVFFEDQWGTPQTCHVRDIIETGE